MSLKRRLTDSPLRRLQAQACMPPAQGREAPRSHLSIVGEHVGALGQAPDKRIKRPAAGQAQQSQPCELDYLQMHWEAHNFE